MDREEILINYNSEDLQEYLRYASKEEILELFNEEGLNILKNNKKFEDVFCYIVTFSEHANELFKNKLFVDTLLNSNLNECEVVFDRLDDYSSDIIINGYFEKNKYNDNFINLFKCFNLKYKLKKLENWEYSKDLLYEIIKNTKEAPIINKIITNYDIDLSNPKIVLRRLFETAKDSVLKARKKRNFDEVIIDSISIPQHLLTKEVKERLWDEYDIYGIRSIINDAYYSTDASALNDYIKQKELNYIDNYSDGLLLPPYDEIYKISYKLKQEEYKIDYDPSYNDDDYFTYRKEFYDLMFTKSDDILEDYIMNEKNIDKIKEHLQELSNKMLSNYIIDYHFEENYHNVMLDLQELLNFYYKGNIAIPKERAELYGRISYIDYLPTEEKIELHNELKDYNMIELLYDDMAFAREIVAEAIKEYSLGTKSIQKYKDKNLSEKYGVDVYNMNGDMFFGLVKNGRVYDKLPTGHSFSLIGHGGVATIGEVKNSNTFLYDAEGMNKEQLIHAFPFDSFTLYQPFAQSEKPSTRVNVLAMPDELVATSSSYNEILILEQGTKKTDMDKRIPLLKKIALYCLDEIRDQDIEKAKQENVGIILIDTKKYERLYNQQDSNIKIERADGGYGYDYFDGFTYKEKYERRR